MQRTATARRLWRAGTHSRWSRGAAASIANRVGNAERPYKRQALLFQSIHWRDKLVAPVGVEHNGCAARRRRGARAPWIAAAMGAISGPRQRQAVLCEPLHWRDNVDTSERTIARTYVRSRAFVSSVTHARAITCRSTAGMGAVGGFGQWQDLFLQPLHWRNKLDPTRTGRASVTAAACGSTVTTAIVERNGAATGRLGAADGPCEWTALLFEPGCGGDSMGATNVEGSLRGRSPGR